MSSVSRILIALVLVAVLACSDAFRAFPSVSRTHTHMKHINLNMETPTPRVEQVENLNKWPGTRPPVLNMLLLEQRMDASWGARKYRTEITIEITPDDVNPMDDWWAKYAPSDEEKEAIMKGYDFKNPKKYFEEKGIDFEKACAETEALTETLFAAHMVVRGIWYPWTSLLHMAPMYQCPLPQARGTSAKHLTIDT
jgi:hypothetical protein